MNKYEKQFMDDDERQFVEYLEKKGATVVPMLDLKITPEKFD